MSAIDTTTYRNPAARAWRTDPAPDVREFHRSLIGYSPTRLVSAPALASELGVASVHVKEESSRFGLPAFKILGASYAISRALVSYYDAGEQAASIGDLRGLIAAHGPVELIAATDGNHGRAVAHMGRLLGLRARIFLPAAITGAAKTAIASEGAECVELDAPYDDIVRAAAAATADLGKALLIQDTSWDGYVQIPRWIVDGYSTLLQEADEQLLAAEIDGPDLVAVPVGVGALAESVVRHYRSTHGAPILLSVEPDAAPALVSSLHAGSAVTVPTAATIMAGLNCGTPAEAGWPVLRAGIDAAVAVSDESAAQAVHDLESLGIDAGPCGAASLAGVRALASTQSFPPHAHLLLLSTEGRSANPLPGRAS